MSTKQDASTANLPFPQARSICKLMCPLSKKSRKHFHCPFCEFFATIKERKMHEHIKSKHGEKYEVTTTAKTSEVGQVREETEKSETNGEGIAKAKNGKQKKRKRKKKAGYTIHSHQEEQATVEHDQGIPSEKNPPASGLLSRFSDHEGNFSSKKLESSCSDDVISDDDTISSVQGDYDDSELHFWSEVVHFWGEEESDRSSDCEQDVQSSLESIQESERKKGLFVLDNLLLDIYKDCGCQSMKLKAMEDSVLYRTGCTFSTLHNKVLPQEVPFESQGIEDFIENDSRYFLENDSVVRLRDNVSPSEQDENMKDEEETINLSNRSITSCTDLVKTCVQKRNATSAVLSGSVISSETWVFAVVDIFRWFCPSLRWIDVTGCKGFSRRNLNKGNYQSKIEIIRNDVLDPFFIANSSDADKKIKEMLARKLISPFASCNGWSLLHSAVLLSDKQLVSQLLECMAEDICYENNNIEDDFLQTALELATSLHNLEIIKLLRSKEVVYGDPSMLVQHCFLRQLCFQTFDHPVIQAVVSNETTLQAARKAHDSLQCDMVAVLVTLCENSDANFKRKVFEEILRRLQSCIETDCCLLFSCWNEKAIRDILQILMREAGCLSDVRVDSLPCLMLSLPSLYVVELLLNDGAKLDDRDNSGCTALFHAVEKALTTLTPYCLNLIKFLLEKKANPNVRSDLGDSPLLHSLTWPLRSCELCAKMMIHATADASSDETISKQTLQVWSLLLNAGARGNVKDEMDRSLLHLLLNCLANKIVKPSICRTLICTGLTFLLKGGLEVNARDDKGNTPLHCWASLSTGADSGDMIEIGSQIIFHGGVVNARNDKGETPLHLSQCWEKVDLLVGKGAQADAQDLRGNTPFHKFIGKSTLIRDQVKEDRWEKCLESGMDLFSTNGDSKCVFDVLLEKQYYKSTLTLLKAMFQGTINPQLREIGVTARNFRDLNGSSLLHAFCGVENEGALSVCECLLGNGWNANLQNTNNETALHLVCKKIGNVNSLSKRICLLRKYHADVRIPDCDGQTCETLLCRDLHGLLHQDIEKVNLPNTIKWTARSAKHEVALKEVASGEKARKVGSFHHHESPIGGGSFALVFPGLNEEDGREVAMKRLEKARLGESGAMLEREIKCLLNLSSCSFVVDYISCVGDDNFQYLIVELMEGSLDQYLSCEQECQQAFDICHNIACGLEFLHSNDILHRDLKPQNILYNTNPQFVVKICDFGISKILHSDQSGALSETVLHSRVGTRCWMAPELLEKNPKDHSKASDIFSCGLVFHYVLAKKKHPFGSYSEINSQNIEKNIISKKKTFCESLTPEAASLLTNMLAHKPKRRPTAPSLQKFPFFWNDRKKVDFLTKVGNQKEFEEPRLNLCRQLTSVEKKLESCYKRYLQGASADWKNVIQKVYDAVTSGYPYRVYKTTSAVELVRFIRNCYTHSHDLPTDVRDLLWEGYIFHEKFPFLVTELYISVKENGTWRERKDLKNFFQ